MKGKLTMTKKMFFSLIVFVYLFFLPIKVSAEEIQPGEYTSTLPVVYINTENHTEITSKEVYLSGTMLLQGNDTLNSSSYLYDGTIEIKGRGNMTWDCSLKKPYHIKLKEGSNLLNLGKGKHWLLLANYYDESLLRNKLASDFAASLGISSMDSTWVDLVLNGVHKGTYQLCEQIRIGKNRVDITNWEEYAEDFAKAVYSTNKENGFTKNMRNDFEDALVQDLSWITSGCAIFNGTSYCSSNFDIQLPNLTGGFLLEIDDYYDEISKFRTKNNYAINIKKPEYLSSNQELLTYTTNYMQLFEDSVFSPNYMINNNQNKYHYSQLVDMDSLVDFWLVTEVMFNIDSGWKSTYLYKDVNDIMKYGPVWDFDLSSGSPYYTKYSYNTWWSNLGNAYYFNRLVNDPYFLTRVRESYWRNHSAIQKMIYTNGSIQNYHNYLSASAVTNSAIWHWSRGFEKDTLYLRTWLKNRIYWMDQQMANQNALLSSLSSYEKSNELQLNITNSERQKYSSDMRKTKIRGDFNVTSQSAIYLETVITDENISQLDIIVNGILFKSFSVNEKTISSEIPRSLLSAEEDELNVLIVYGKNAAGNILHSNFVTLFDTTEKEIYCQQELDGKILCKYAVLPTTTPIPSATVTPSFLPEPTSQTTVSESPDIIMPQETAPVEFSSLINKEEQSPNKKLKKNFRKKNLFFQILSLPDKKNGTVMITGVAKKNSKSITVPKMVTFQGEKYYIVAIKRKCFSSCKKLKFLHIKTTTLRRVGKKLFYFSQRKITIRVPKSKKKYYQKLFSKHPKAQFK